MLLDRRRRLHRRRPGRHAAWRSASSHGRGGLGRRRPRSTSSCVDHTVVPAKRRHRRDLGQRGRRRRTSPASRSARSPGLLQPARDLHRAVIEPYVDFSSLDLVGVVVPSGTASDRSRDRGRREPAVRRTPRAGRRSPPSSSPCCCRSRVFPHLAWHGVVPDLVPARRRRRRADPRPAVRHPARLRGRAAARPRTAGRPRRRPVGAGAARRRYVAGRVRRDGTGPTAARGRRLTRGRAGVVRRHLGLRALRAGAARPRRRRRRPARGGARRACCTTCCSRRSCCRRLMADLPAARAASRSTRLMAASEPTPTSEPATGRLRLIVIQALVFSLLRDPRSPGSTTSRWSAGGVPGQGRLPVGARHRRAAAARPDRRRPWAGRSSPTG